MKLFTLVGNTLSIFAVIATVVAQLAENPPAGV